jgi:hypothetical protein
MKKILVLIIPMALVVGVMLWIVLAKPHPEISGASPVSSIHTPSRSEPPSLPLTSTSKPNTKSVTLQSVAESGVAGDGTLTRQGSETLIAIRLVIAPPLLSTFQYEVYVVPAAGADPVYVGTLLKLGGKNEQYIWGGAGKLAWYQALEILITQRSQTSPKPGVIVARGLVQPGVTQRGGVK